MMSLLGNTGQYVCDRCGVDVGNGSIGLCCIVTDLDPEVPGIVRSLHFCRENGCCGKVLSSRNLQHLRDQQSKEAEEKTLRERVADQQRTIESLKAQVAELGG